MFLNLIKKIGLGKFLISQLTKLVRLATGVKFNYRTPVINLKLINVIVKNMPYCTPTMNQWVVHGRTNI